MVIFDAIVFCFATMDRAMAIAISMVILALVIFEIIVPILPVRTAIVILRSCYIVRSVAATGIVMIVLALVVVIAMLVSALGQEFTHVVAHGRWAQTA